MKNIDLSTIFSYECAIAALALSFCSMAINSSMSELFHFQYSSVYTAGSMYLPLLFFLGIVLAVNRKAGISLVHGKGLLLLLFLCSFWLVNYFQEIAHAPSGSLSEYDQKRIWLFVHGVLLSGLAGLHVPHDPRRFIRCFLIAFCVISAVASVSYLCTYRPGETGARLLGERALGAGLIACFGLASCLSLLLLHLVGSHMLSSRLLVVLVAAILIHIATITLSATRGAALSSAASVIVFAWMARRSRKVWAILGVLIVSFLGVALVARPYVPEATINRLLMRAYGVGLRYELTRTMLDLLLEHPCGRVFGYDDTKLSMNYSHNAFLQYLGEAGPLQTAPVMLVLLYGIVRNLIRHRANVHVQALGLLALPVLIESLSAGSAYDSFLWFCVFCIFSLREDWGDTEAVEQVQQPWSTASMPDDHCLTRPYP